jgi:hypothetical protein
MHINILNMVYKHVCRVHILLLEVHRLLEQEQEVLLVDSAVCYSMKLLHVRH